MQTEKPVFTKIKNKSVVAITRKYRQIFNIKFQFEHFCDWTSYWEIDNVP